jgi:ADP-ribosyl-[dinitrogen reductase] hydrolase
MNRRTREHYIGCLIGGASGDALGAPLEFFRLAEIRRRFGPDGLKDYAPAYGRLGAITDDTQMTLFTAEGLLQALGDDHGAGSEGAIVETVHRAYLRWLYTQGVPWDRRRMGEREGLVEHRELHSRRGPGSTCLGALEASLESGQPSPIAESKGCGGVMRIAPVGLVLPASPFAMGCQLAALTHGHPSGYLPAGFMAQVIADLVKGEDLGEAIDQCMERLADEEGHEETTAALQRALELARGGKGTAEEVEQIGGGWMGHEALAIALFCALKAESYSHGVLLAVNHGGDSDSTGSITGNFLGLIYGIEVIPSCWVEQLELREVIEKAATNLLLPGRE